MGGYAGMTDPTKSALDNSAGYTDYTTKLNNYGYTPNQAEYDGMMADGTFDATMQGMQQNQIGSMFDMPTMDAFKMGIGGINSVAGLLGTIDSMKTNKLQRKGYEQNMKHAAMARDDRTNFLGGTASAFA